MPLDRTSTRALYQQLADKLRMHVYTGDLAAGRELPSEHELMAEYDASRSTIRAALGLLVNEGLIATSGRGGRYFVRERAPLLFVASRSESKKRRDITARDAWVTDVIEQGRNPKQVIDVSIVHPPKEIASRLGLDEGETAVARRRFRYVDDVPYGTSISYFPLAIVRGSEIVEPTDIERGTNRVLAELGHEQVRYVDQITARMPTSDEVSALEIPAGTPIYEHVRTGYDTNDCAVRVAVSVLPSDKHIIQYELTSGN